MARVLIVEDEPLIAMMVSDWLEEMGHEPVGPAASVDRAMDYLAPGEPELHAAILDMNLRGVSSTPIAGELQTRAIPFVFSTGDSSRVDPAYQDRPQLSKPYAFEAFQAALGKLLAEPRSA